MYDSFWSDGTIAELQPGATGKRGHTRSFGSQTIWLNGVVQITAATDLPSVYCENATEPSWWRKLTGSFKVGLASSYQRVEIETGNPAASSGEQAAFTITAHVSDTNPLQKILQACVNLRCDGVAPVDADGDGNHDVVIYDGPNGKYKEDGTLNQYSQGNDLGYRRAGRLEYDSGGYDEDVESYRHRPQCSGADGKFEGGLFRIGNTETRTALPHSRCIPRG